MSFEDDRDFWIRREADERAAAKAAENRTVRDIHLLMSALYNDRIDSLDDAPCLMASGKTG